MKAEEIQVLLFEEEELEACLVQRIPRLRGLLAQIRKDGKSALRLPTMRRVLDDADTEENER